MIGLDQHHGRSAREHRHWRQEVWSRLAPVKAGRTQPVPPQVGHRLRPGVRQAWVLRVPLLNPASGRPLTGARGDRPCRTCYTRSRGALASTRSVWACGGLLENRHGRSLRRWPSGRELGVSRSNCSTDPLLAVSFGANRADGHTVKMVTDGALKRMQAAALSQRERRYRSKDCRFRPGPMRASSSQPTRLGTPEEETTCQPVLSPGVRFCV